MILSHPVEIVRITTDWMGYPNHKGRDYGWVVWAITRSRRVKAAASGRVVRVMKGFGPGRTASGNYGYGNQVIIEHAPGVYTTYNHLSTISVKVGQWVSTGQYLGQMGKTGDASKGVHLHFEVRIGGIGEKFRVDPRPYFSRHLPGTEPKPTPAAPAKPKPSNDREFPKVQFATTDVNMRRDPVVRDDNSIMVLRKHATVFTGRRINNWLYCKTEGGRTGWIHRDYLTEKQKRTTAALNIRTGASTDAKIFGVIPKGELVDVLDIAPGDTKGQSKWRKVKSSRGTGWVSNDYLKA